MPESELSQTLDKPDGREPGRFASGAFRAYLDLHVRPLQADLAWPERNNWAPAEVQCPLEAVSVVLRINS